MSFNNIGFFQFDNLMQSRVPLLLVMLGEFPVKSWYNSLVGMHLDNVTLISTPEKVISQIQEKKLPAHFAIVVLDAHEESSPSVVEKLENLGFINTYYVKGGWKEMLLEKGPLTNV